MGGLHSFDSLFLCHGYKCIIFTSWSHQFCSKMHQFIVCNSMHLKICWDADKGCINYKRILCRVIKKSWFLITVLKMCFNKNFRKVFYATKNNAHLISFWDFTSIWSEMTFDFLYQEMQCSKYKSAHTKKEIGILKLKTGF